MAVSDYLKLKFDAAQVRIKVDRVQTQLNGLNWSQAFWVDGWVDPIRKTGMLLPAPLSPQWSTSSGGIFARLRLTDYSTPTPAEWTEMDRGRCAGDYYMKSLNINEAVITNSTWQKNRGFFISWYGYNVGNDDFIQMECGYGPVAGDHDLSSLSLKFFSSGKVEVYRNGLFDGEGSITGNISESVEWAKSSSQTSSETIDVVIIPFRKREVLIWSNQGGGYSHVCQDISEDEEDPIITRTGDKFWWYTPTGTATVQSAPLRFPSTGYLTAKRAKFLEAPTGEALYRIIYDVPGYGTQSVEGVLTQPGDPEVLFTADGENKDCRFRINFTGDGISTAFVYGGIAYYEAETVNTPEESAVEITGDDYLMEASLHVPDNHPASSWEIVLKSPKTLEDSSNEKYIPLLTMIGNRPVNVYRGATLFTSGRLDPDEYRLGQISQDEASRVTFTIRDSWQALENYRPQDDIPYDRMNLSDIVKDVLKTVGFDPEVTTLVLDIDDTDYEVPSNGTTEDGKFVEVWERGQSAAEYLMQLHDKYAGTHLYGFAPHGSEEILFYWKDPAELDSTPVCSIYPTVEEARVALGGDENESDGDERSKWQRIVYRSFRKTRVKLEANDIWVLGYDPCTQLPILGHKSDDDSKDPETAPEERPANWAGETLRYAWKDSSISTRAALERAVNLLYSRLTPGKVVAEWESDLLYEDDTAIPVWKRKVVHVEGQGDFRIVAISGQHILEPSNTSNRQKTEYQYIGELVEETEVIS